MSHHKSYAQVCGAGGRMVLVFVFVHVCDYMCEQHLFLLWVMRTGLGIEDGGKSCVIHFTFL